MVLRTDPGMICGDRPGDVSRAPLSGGDVSSAISPCYGRAAFTAISRYLRSASRGGREDVPGNAAIGGRAVVAANVQHHWRGLL